MKRKKKSNSGMLFLFPGDPKEPMERFNKSVDTGEVPTSAEGQSGNASSGESMGECKEKDREEDFIDDEINPVDWYDDYPLDESYSPMEAYLKLKNMD